MSHAPLPGDRPTDDSLAPFLAPGEYVDSHHPSVHTRATRLAAPDAPPGAVAVAAFDFVRDLPYEADDFDVLDTYRASHVLEVGHGYCVSKASLFVALLRARGVPARLRFADVRNHLASGRLRRAMGTDLFAWHGYGEVFLGDRWVQASPTFDAGLCRRVGVPPLRVDGVHDALLQAFDGTSTMTYVTTHGWYHDVPARFLAAEMPRRYPFTRDHGISRFKAGGPVA
jgi:transglutaminase-like putative cysteine protease